tara:strand:- start:8869 stop:9483 length:615 start_codon:yes stop_codon:yes gene_type:complete
MALTKLNFGGNQQALVAANIPTITGTQLPIGAILQTVSTNDMTSASYSGNSSTTPSTVISLAITPSATSSKILLTGFISIGGKYSDHSAALDYIGVRLKRGSTVIGETTDLSTATTVHGADASGASPMHSVVKDAGYSASRPASVPFHFVDSPSTTSATTYNIQGIIEHSGSTRIMLRNIAGYNYNNDEMASGTCQLTLQEIKG